MSRKSKEELMEELQHAENQIADRIADNMNTFGVSSTVGRLLGIIYLNRAPMTLDDLAEKTGMSRTRMSQVMREMMALNIADKESVRGSRKEHYTVENDYIQTFISLFTTNWMEVVSKNSLLARRLQDKIDAIEQDAGNDAAPEIEAKISELKQELEDWITYYDWIRRLVDFFESREVLDYVPLNENKDQGGRTNE
ncbi:GbsR/MarR family transcriptional regulator [Shouchella shacheensis]|uniref:GbsR/MarR family transcriptional regulator n=1 Tax=Shouchella shacheensis TaxID=1649580 RepID=UPI00073FD2A4|nr:GbsR/MarR family transcriptional regulator [Shouchella shacheensis]